MSYRLNSGTEIPCIGFGTYKATAGEQKDVLAKAIEAGYRYFDTASFYKNEEDLGEALAKSGIPRKQFFLASKVWKTELGYEETRRACRESLERLGTDYLDLYLIHWPKQSPEDMEWKERIADTWRAMEELQKEGILRDIGVSNFLVHHLEELLKTAKMCPAVDQIEFHPGYLQEDTVRFCHERGILVQAWSPIGRKRVFEEPLLIEIAEHHGKSLAQICLKFALQSGVMPLPKSSAMSRMKENLDLSGFELTSEEMEAIRSMPQVGWSGEHPDRERVYF